MFICECGKEFGNSQSFNGHKANCRVHFIAKYGNDEYYNVRHNRSKESLKKATDIAADKKNQTRQTALERWLSEQHTCENCGKVMTEKYGSGRFCCRACSNARKHSEETKQKISSTLAKINNPDQFDNISDDAFIEAFNKATSVDDLIQTISAITGKHITRNGIQRQCKRLGLNLDDIKLQAKSLDDILFNKVPFPHTSRLKQKLLEAGYKEDKCECCGQGPEWLGKRLPLELHHADGNRKNNSLENLKILCPNCHSQTDTFRSKNRKKK